MTSRDPDAGDLRAWPTGDRSRVPYFVYTDDAVFRAEEERIFHGPVWHYLGLEAEIPAPGDYLTTYVGVTPVVLNRGRDGVVHAFVNRCSHRGATVVRGSRGNCRVHTCLYHQWSFDSAGTLVGVPYRKGVNGQGGFPEDFCPENHGLRKLRVETYRGIAFGTLGENAPTLAEFLGAPITARLDRLCSRPMTVIGYQRQRIQANWKLMVENVKDAYHGALLHAFNSKFGFFRSTQKGDVTTAGGGLHSILTTYSTHHEKIDSAFDDKVTTYKPKLTLEDSSMFRTRREYHDDIVTSILAIFPSLLLLHGANFLCFRQLRPRSAGEFDMIWTYAGFADDDADLTDLRVRQGNLVGPAGYVSMEDAEALELIQRAVAGEGRDAMGVVALGGRDVADQDHLVTEVAIRAFWSGYRGLMGFERAA